MSGTLIQCWGLTVVLLALHFDGAVLSFALFKWPQRVAESSSPALAQCFVLSPVLPSQPL